MTVSVEGKLVTLTGNCGVEEAEPLLSALVEDSSRTVQLAAEKVHTSIWQVLLATRAHVIGESKNTFVVQHILPLVLDQKAPAGPGRREPKPRRRRSEK